MHDGTDMLQLLNLAVIFPIKHFDESVKLTLDSLASQIKVNLICIVVAEGQILEKLRLDRTALKFLPVERPAKGVYNALNAGLESAQVLTDLDSVSFISSGAVLASKDSLYELASRTRADSWAVGSWNQVYEKSPNRIFLPPTALESNSNASKLRHFSSYLPLNIEALVLGAELAATLRFDESKKIGADFKLFATLLSQNAPVSVSQKPHVVLPAPGLSSEQRLLGQREVAKARFEISASVNGFGRRFVLTTVSLALLMFEYALNKAGTFVVAKKPEF